jgi:hypothetical protein
MRPYTLLLFKSTDEVGTQVPGTATGPSFDKSTGQASVFCLPLFFKKIALPYIVLAPAYSKFLPLPRSYYSVSSHLIPGLVDHVIKIVPRTPVSVEAPSPPCEASEHFANCTHFASLIVLKLPAGSKLIPISSFLNEPDPPRSAFGSWGLIESLPLLTLLPNRKFVSSQPYSSGELPMEFREKAMISFLGTFLNWQ